MIWETVSTMPAAPAVGRPIRVQIFQPVIAHYQVPFFERLASLPQFEIHVSASAEAPVVPKSAATDAPWASIGPACKSLLGGRLVWQPATRIPTSIGKGDVVVVDGNPRYLSTYPLVRAARRRGAAVVWWGHGWSSSSVRWRARLRYRLMSLSDVVVVYTERERGNLQQSGLVSRPVFGINNTIDVSVIDRAVAQWSAERLAAFQVENGIAGAPLMLFSGRLRSRPPTELDVLLRAIALLPSGPGSVRVAVVGSGDDERRLRALAASLGVEDRILWLGAIYDEQQLAPWFLSASLMVYPGSIGLSLLHAFAYRLPVVIHSNHALHGPEAAALHDGVNGRLFTRGGHVELASVLRSMLASPSELSAMATAARSTIDGEFSLGSMVERFAAALMEAARIARGGD